MLHLSGEYLCIMASQSFLFLCLISIYWSPLVKVWALRMVNEKVECVWDAKWVGKDTWPRKEIIRRGVSGCDSCFMGTERGERCESDKVGWWRVGRGGLGIWAETWRWHWSRNFQVGTYSTCWKNGRWLNRKWGGVRRRGYHLGDGWGWVVVSLAGKVSGLEVLEGGQEWRLWKALLHLSVMQRLRCWMGSRKYAWVMLLLIVPAPGQRPRLWNRRDNRFRLCPSKGYNGG